mgnify:CR=1 FL=1
MNTYDFSPMLRYSVGFDRMQRLLETTTGRSETSYPPYNIETNNEDSYRVSVAVAGFEKSELDVIVENDILSVTGSKLDRDYSENFVHRGIAGRNFHLKFNLADYIKINGASLQNGILTIELEREIPEELKPRQIEIKAVDSKSLGDKAKKFVGSEKKVA